jgi:hypothetical protein
MSVTTDFTKMMPGFDFLQSLMKGAGAGLPGMNQWVAPTLDPDELEKRIGDLRTVQFWLEQNARILAATVQTLEVQRLTLTTLKTMNLPLADISESLRIKLPDPPAPPPAAAPAPAPMFRMPEPEPAPEPAAPEPQPAETAAPAAAVVDPMAWWGALTQQFTELAAKAMKDVRADAAAAAEAAAGVPGTPPAAARKAVGKVAKKAARKTAKRAAAKKPVPKPAAGAGPGSSGRTGR